MDLTKILEFLRKNTVQHRNPHKNALRKLKKRLGSRQYRKMRKIAQKTIRSNVNE